MGNGFIHCKDAIKYLGVIIDEKLCWRQHIDYVCDRARKVAQQLRVACKLTWGLTRDAMRTIYLGAIEPAITYGAAIWGNNIRVREVNKLRSVQRVMAIGAAAAYRTVSTEALLVIGDLVPIEGKIREASERWSTRNSGQVRDGDAVVEVERRGLVNSRHPASNCGISFDTIGTEFSADNVIYTDGSKGENGIGAAIAVYRRGREISNAKFRLGNRCTVFQSEMLAIKGAVEFINNSENGEWHIISDSRSALHALEFMRKPTELMVEVQELIRVGATRGKTILFHWTKAHVGNIGNERADALAKEATRENNRDPTYDRAPFSFAKRIIRTTAISNWNNGWVNSTKGRATFNFFRTVNERQAYRGEINHAMTQLMTGHGNFASYLKKIGKTQSEDCACGLGAENWEHVMFSCSLTQEYRDRAHREMVLAGLGWPDNIQALVDVRREAAFWTCFRRFACSVPGLKL